MLDSLDTNYSSNVFTSCDVVAFSPGFRDTTTSREKVPLQQRDPAKVNEVSSDAQQAEEFLNVLSVEVKVKGDQISWAEQLEILLREPDSPERARRLAIFNAAEPPPSLHYAKYWRSELHHQLQELLNRDERFYEQIDHLDPPKKTNNNSPKNRRPSWKDDYGE